MKVFLANTSLQHAYGGPAHSVSRLAASLGEAGVQVGLWSPDESALSTPLLDARAPVIRLGGTLADAYRQFGKPDLVHDNGIWLAHHHAIAALAAKARLARVVSTRGMLEPWALQHKGWKKRIAWPVYQRRDLQRARWLHATAAAESEALAALALKVPIRVIPNGVDLPLLGDIRGPRAATQNNEDKTAIFVGRIYPVKGLPMLIEAWSRVRPQGWRLEIVGPDEAGHRAEVEQAIDATGLQRFVVFRGPLHDAAKLDALLRADLFVLPTHSENFGMAIAEALAHELPVLTTTRAPWPTLVEHRCGWWVEPTADALSEALLAATVLDRPSLQAMGRRGRELVASQFSWPRVAREFIALYQCAAAA